MRANIYFAFLLYSSTCLTLCRGYGIGAAIDTNQNFLTFDLTLGTQVQGSGAPYALANLGIIGPFRVELNYVGTAAFFPAGNNGVVTVNTPSGYISPGPTIPVPGVYVIGVSTDVCASAPTIGTGLAVCGTLAGGNSATVGYVDITTFPSGTAPYTPFDTSSLTGATSCIDVLFANGNNANVVAALTTSDPNQYWLALWNNGPYGWTLQDSVLVTGPYPNGLSGNWAEDFFVIQTSPPSVTSYSVFGFAYNKTVDLATLGLGINTLYAVDYTGNSYVMMQTDAGLLYMSYNVTDLYGDETLQDVWLDTSFSCAVTGACYDLTGLSPPFVLPPPFATSPYWFDYYGHGDTRAYVAAAGGNLTELNVLDVPTSVTMPDIPGWGAPIFSVGMMQAQYTYPPPPALTTKATTVTAKRSSPPHPPTSSTVRSPPPPPKLKKKKPPHPPPKVKHPKHKKHPPPPKHHHHPKQHHQ